MVVFSYMSKHDHDNEKWRGRYAKIPDSSWNRFRDYCFQKYGTTKMFMSTELTDILDFALDGFEHTRAKIYMPQKRGRKESVNKIRLQIKQIVVEGSNMRQSDLILVPSLMESTIRGWISKTRGNEPRTMRRWLGNMQEIGMISPGGRTENATTGNDRLAPKVETIYDIDWAAVFDTVSVEIKKTEPEAGS